MKYKVFHSIIALILVLGLVAVQTPTPVHAATLTVTNNNDSGPGSLRQAILDASDGDTIDFDANYTITLNSQLPVIDKTLTINGNGAANTIIQASACDPVTLPGGCTPATYRVFEVNVSGNLTLDGLTVQNGNCSGACDTNSPPQGGYWGGGILNDAGVLTITNSIVSGNSAEFGGGGVWNDSNGTLTVVGSTFLGNSVIVGGSGGGIFIRDNSTATITNSSFSGNSAIEGGGIWNSGALTITNSTFSGNSALGCGLFCDDRGGGIWNSGTLTVADSTFSGNSAGDYGGGIVNGGALTLNNSTISDNTAYSGGGIYNFSVGIVELNNSIVSENVTSVSGSGIRNLGTLRLTDTTVMNNSATDNGVSGAGITNEGTAVVLGSSIIGNVTTNIGAGIANFGTFYLVNSTVSGNSVGGIVNVATLIMNNATISNNTASFGSGGLINSPNATATLRNTILAGNFGPTTSPDCSGTLESDGYNLIQSTANCTINGDTTGNLLGVDPFLGPLQDNGGPTLTHALLTGSPAIDAGNPAGCTDQDGNLLTADQRGVARPQGAACDIGAFELEVESQFLDDFNRADGLIGGNWTGNTSQYRISNNQLQVWGNGSNTDIYWNEAFGPDQEAFITFNNINKFAVEQDLLLKAQSNQTWGDGVIEVLYNPSNQIVQVWTWEWPQGWIQYGDDIPVTFVDGDTFGARARPDGIVEVYRNGVLIETRDVSSWSYYDQGGYIGLWFIGAQDTRLDNFGGGDVP